MIRSCNDIKTLNDFYEFSRSWRNACEMGLEETTNIISWSEITLINPELFSILTEPGETND